jgi:hypothetical protein
VDGTEACSAFFDAGLARVKRCDISSAADIEAGRAKFLRVCLNAMAAPGSGYQPAFLKQCTDAVARVEDCAPSREAFPECAQPGGSLPGGAVCGDSIQCASGTCRQFSLQADAGAEVSQCGTCSAESPADGPCSATQRCSGSLTCTNGRCTPPIAAEGQSCGSSARCSAGLNCSIDSSGANPICKRPPADGEACTGICAAGLYCDTTCKRRPARGETCTFLGTCATGLFCEQTSHTCKDAAVGKAGDVCETIEVLCGPNLTCRKTADDKFVCQARVAENDACKTSSECERFLRCTAGTCQVPNAAVCK